jgi:hypothetical protein
MQSFSFAKLEGRGFTLDWKVDEATLLGYTGQCVAWIRVCWLQEPGPDGFDGVSYWANNVLLFDALAEDWKAETIVGCKGQDLFDVLATPRDANPDSEAYKVAEKVVWELLAGSTMQKIAHGRDLTHSLHCGVLLDEAEMERRDVWAGTFGEVLRWGSVCLEQRREGVGYVEAAGVEERLVVRKGLLEA